MKRVPPELESLMWTLAEEGNQRAMEEFGERHPELRTELLHRIEMVKGLRGAKRKPASEPPKPIPRFVPKEPKSGKHAYIVGALVLAALGALAFAVTTLLTPAPHAHLPTQIEQPSAPPVVAESAPKQEVAISPPANTSAPAPAKQTDENEAPPKLGSLKIEHAPLYTVLEMMSSVCNVDIQPAPGLPNPDVVVDYSDMTAMDMLHDLGKQYSFTAMDQHDGTIIVIPAVDPRDRPLGYDPNGSFNARKVGG